MTGEIIASDMSAAQSHIRLVDARWFGGATGEPAS
jgi:hypothetical protein